jgi:hypothetical protein
MKTLIKISLVIIMVIASTATFAQKRHPHPGRHPHRGGKVVVVKRSPFRPKKVVVYHPAWRPGWACNRRWVYFPRYNFYWDNWRNHYVFLNGATWVSQPAPPPAVANVNLANEKHYELKEDEDDADEIGQYNTAHKETYKGD